MRAALLLVIVLHAACAPPAWVAPVAPAMDEGADSARDGMLRVWRRATAAREQRFAEALHPGAGRRERARRLARGGLDDFRAGGEELFALDTPWDASDPVRPIAPLHARGGAATADSTRCLGCHHVGGDGGSGGYGDLAFFDAQGDDVLSARRRMPRMLAGAALLERAADGHPERAPFGWKEGRPRTLQEMVRWSLETHLGASASDEEQDALTAFIALLPAPAQSVPPHDSLVLRVQRGAELFRQIGCGECHVEALSVEDPVLRLGGGRRIDLRLRLSRDGQPPYRVAALTDLRPHHMGAALGEGEPDAQDVFVTPPLWGVASRGPFLHDGRAASLVDAVLAHGGEAKRARDAYAALGSDAGDVQLYLASLGRPPMMTWVR